MTRNSTLNDLPEFSRVRRSSWQARHTYDRLSSSYDWLSARSERRYKMAGLELLEPQPGEVILEIGCGTGEALAKIHRSVQPGGLSVGLDLSGGMLRMSNRRLLAAGIPATLVMADMLAIPLAPASVDAVFASFTIELLDTPLLAHLFVGLRRVLKPVSRITVVALDRPAPPTPTVRLYEWLHNRFPAALDCRPIPTARLVEANNFKITAQKRMTMWGLPVCILCAQVVDPIQQNPGV